jgi:hypothetical protein
MVHTPLKSCFPMVKQPMAGFAGAALSILNGSWIYGDKPDLISGDLLDTKPLDKRSQRIATPRSLQFGFSIFRLHFLEPNSVSGRIHGSGSDSNIRDSPYCRPGDQILQSFVDPNSRYGASDGPFSSARLLLRGKSKY